MGQHTQHEPFPDGGGTVPRSVLDAPTSAVAAASGGLAGGIAFGVVMQSNATIPMVAALVGSASAPVGWGTHLMISVTLGTAFGMAVYRVASRAVLWTWALAYGVAWWVLGALLLMPYLLGMPPFTVDGRAWASLAGHLLFAAGTAAGTLLLDPRERP